MPIALGVRGKKVPWRERFWEKVDRSSVDGCWEWLGAIGTTGYGVIRGDAPRGTPANIRSNRAAWIITHGEPPSGMDVCHRCDNRRCVRPDHLFLGTRQENMSDCKEKGRTCRGDARARKLSLASVELIRRRIEDREPDAKIAVDFGVSTATIHGIRKGRLWAAT